MANFPWAGISRAFLAMAALLGCSALLWQAQAYTSRCHSAHARLLVLESEQKRLLALEEAVMALPDIDKAKIFIAINSSVTWSPGVARGHWETATINKTIVEEDAAPHLRQLTACCECTTTTTTARWEWKIIEGEGDGCEWSIDNSTNDNCIQTVNYPNNYPAESYCAIEIGTAHFSVFIEEWDVEDKRRDVIIVHGVEWGGHRGPPSPFIPTGGDRFLWSTDGRTEQGGWRMCVRPTCATFSCPGGLSLKPNASSIACSSNECSSADVSVCCDVGCDRPHDLGSAFTVPEGCEAGESHSTADCLIGCAGTDLLDGMSPPQRCLANGTFTEPGCRPHGNDFPWIIHGDCQRYGPGCVSSIGVGGEYEPNEVCVVDFNIPDDDHISHYKTVLTYMDAQVGDTLMVGGVIIPFPGCQNYEDRVCYDDPNIGTFRANHRQGDELSGTIRESMEWPELMTLFWTSDEVAHGTGWIVCAVVPCTRIQCPAGYRYSCEAEDRWCQSHDCSATIDTETCCVVETEEDANLYGFTMGQAGNPTWCSLSTTTTTSSVWTTKLDTIGHIKLLLEDLPHGETMEGRTDVFKRALSDAFVQLALVDVLDVIIQVNFFNVSFVETAFRLEQTDVQMDELSNEEYIAAINGKANITLVQAVTHRIMHSVRPTRDFYGYRNFGGGCTDLYPCDSDLACWVEGRHQVSCAYINEHNACFPGRTAGPDFDTVFWDIENFEKFLRQRDDRFGLEFLEEVCCTCGGGGCNHGTYRIFNDMPTLCIPCPAGSTSVGDAPWECVECEPGRYSDALALPECIACPTGQFINTSGATTCTACSAGTIASVEGHSSCELCPPGTTSNSRHDECVACPLGFFAADNGTTACEACPVGHFQREPGMSECEPCDLGTAAGGIGQTACVACDAGRYADTYGLTACQLCSPGQAQPNLGASTCEDCEMAYFARLQGQSECILCGAGTETTEPGQSECIRCMPGFVKADGEMNCTACASGAFASEPGLTACRECGPGARANMPEAATGCMYCEIGRFSSAERVTACAACSAGTYMSEESATACIECDPGEFFNETGGSSCLSCLPGTYSPVAGAPTCTECLPGQEAVRRGLTQCDHCLAGSFAAAAGTPSCSACAPGSYSPLAGSTACVTCRQGRFAATQGLSECPFCGPGSYADQEGVTRCTGCNDTLPGEAEFWTTMRPPTEEDPARPSGIKPWIELRGANSITSCGCRPGTQPYHGGVCKECGEGLICLGMGVLEIEEGYAWDFAYSTWDCEHGVPEACPGGVPGRCMPGRDEEAVGCAVCLPKLVPVDDGSCVKCADGDVLLPTFLVLLALIVVIVMYLVFDSPKRKRPKLSLLLIVASLGQAVTIIQQLGIISLIRVEWSSPLLDVFTTITEITFFDLEVLRPRCIAKLDVVRMYTMRVLFAIICLGVICVAHLLSQLLQHRRTWRTRWPTLCCALGTIVLTFFVSILSTMLGPLQCQKHPNDRQTVSWYPSIVCWEGGSHTHMILIGSSACLLPLAFLIASLWAIKSYPRSLLQGKTQFLNMWAFLFFRYNPEAYWYGPVMLVRNAMVAAVPVLTSPVLQILGLEVIMLFSLILLLTVMPWRVHKANQVDAAGHVCLILVTMMASFYVDQDSMHFISVLSVAMILAVPVVLMAVLAYATLKLLKSFLRPFQFFLCHHKHGAGCFCRLLKIYLLKTAGVTRKVFIDTDDLTNLDTLFDVVAHETETLVVVHSQNILLRPWCIGEITTAHRSRLRIVRTSMPGVMPPSDEFIANFLRYVPDISCLTQFGLDVDMIQEALRALATSSDIKMPQEIFESSIVALSESLVSGKTQDEELCSHQTKHNTRPEVAIVANKLDLEAAATAMILQTLINPIIQIQEACLSLVLGVGEQVPATVTKGLLLCTNGVFTAHVLEILLECKARNSIVLPVMGESNFVFPSEAWMCEQASFLALSETRRQKATRLIQAIFTEIAVDFQPSALSGTEATLNIKAHEIASRIFGGMTTVSDKVSEMFDRKSKDRLSEGKRRTSVIGATSSSTSAPSVSQAPSCEVAAADSEIGRFDSNNGTEAPPADEIWAAEAPVGNHEAADPVTAEAARVSEVMIVELELGSDLTNSGALEAPTEPFVI